LQELTAEDASGWLHVMCNRLFSMDMFAHIRSSQDLLRIHSTAEQFDPAAEAFSGPFQVRFPACCNLLALCACLLSLHACPLHLPCVFLVMPFAPALRVSLLAFCTCPVWLSACLCILPCLSLLALCTCPMSLSACPFHLPSVSLLALWACPCLLPLLWPQWCMFLPQTFAF